MMGQDYDSYPQGDFPEHVRQAIREAEDAAYKRGWKDGREKAAVACEQSLIRKDITDAMAEYIRAIQPEESGG